MTRIKKNILKVMCLISFWSYSQSDIITINPEDIKQEVVFGGDNKLTIKAWAEGNIHSVSQKLFKDMDLKIIRVPIFALQDISDGIYDNVIDVVNSIKAVNPNVKVFASIANGDGYGVNHHGASKFPSGWTGCCDYNVYKLNLTAYSAYLDSFMQRMTDAGITIDYLGPYNEDPGDDSDYTKIINQMTKLGDTEIIGGESYALSAAISIVDDIEDRIVIMGSHFYDDNTINEADWDSTWATLVEKSENPVWYTEATRYSNGDNINLLIAGLDNIFAPIRGGAEAVIFYQVCKRFVYANGSKLPIKYSGFQNVVNNTKGNYIVSNSNNENIKLIAFKDGDNLDVHVINNNSSEHTVRLQLLNDYTIVGNYSTKEWTASSTALSNSYTNTETSSVNVTLPATSYTYYNFTLNKSTGLSNESILNSKETKIIPNPVTNGNFNIDFSNKFLPENINLKLFSISGELVFSKTQNSREEIVLDKNIPSGIYILSIEYSKGKICKKLIIQ
ncbi:T9SS type A sorting domain-containing protein [Wenyingzhuangia sp. 2_MG-2023]|uniref:T9SS type A sorting domain-containing protein n=1 Tax=Wenyingzhuangia sp. 2_MG-2023 TaxID=3062639 RepID=UPI0026E2C7FD|nr:T9SS type A sorting domain-containing protein [Wenyingzhuangia sp. 2_MG-2023]